MRRIGGDSRTRRTIIWTPVVITATMSENIAILNCEPRPVKTIYRPVQHKAWKPSPYVAQLFHNCFKNWQGDEQLKIYKDNQYIGYVKFVKNKNEYGIFFTDDNLYANTLFRDRKST